VNGQYEAIIAAVDKAALLPENKAKVRACMQLQRYSGLALQDAVTLTKEELIQEGEGKRKVFRVQTSRHKTKTRINNVIPTWLGEELLKVKNGNPKYFFWAGTTASAENATSFFHKMYAKVFKASGVATKRPCGSHDFRHTYAVSLLQAGVDMRKVSKALGHFSAFPRALARSCGRLTAALRTPLWLL
jgi:integrase